MFIRHKRDVRNVYKRSITDVTRAVCDVTNLSLGSSFLKLTIWKLQSENRIVYTQNKH